MRKLSSWARQHRWLVRILIVFFIYPLLNIIGWALGDMLHFYGVNIAISWGYPLSFLCLFLFCIYPSRKNKNQYRNFYRRQKALDFSLILVSFSFVLLTGNNYHVAVERPTISNISYGTSITESTSTAFPSSKIKKDKRKNAKAIVQKIRNKYRNADDGTKTLLIILSVLAAIGLVLLLGALACSVACSGSEGLAYVIFFLGLGGIIFGLVRLIERISKGRRKKAADLKTS